MTERQQSTLLTCVMMARRHGRLLRSALVIQTYHALLGVCTAMFWTVTLHRYTGITRECRCLPTGHGQRRGSARGKVSLPARRTYC